MIATVIYLGNKQLAMIYVDELMDWPIDFVAPGARHCGTKWCHMTADTEDELHQFAAKLGLKREWFQCPPKASHPHYDLVPSKRKLALKMGAQFKPLWGDKSEQQRTLFDV